MCSPGGVVIRVIQRSNKIYLTLFGSNSPNFGGFPALPHFMGIHTLTLVLMYVHIPFYVSSVGQYSTHCGNIENYLMIDPISLYRVLSAGFVCTEVNNFLHFARRGVVLFSHNLLQS